MRKYACNDFSVANPQWCKPRRYLITRIVQCFSAAMGCKLLISCLITCARAGNHYVSHQFSLTDKQKLVNAVLIDLPVEKNNKINFQANMILTW